MIADDLISKAFRLFDEETDSKYEQDGNRTTALELLNDGYLDVCIETRCSRKTDVISTVSGTREYDYPPDFLLLQSADYNGCYRLDPISYQRIETKYNLKDTGSPRYFYLTADKIGFVPFPNGSYSINLVYYSGPTDELELEDSPSLVPELWQPRILPYYILWKLFAIDKREDVVARTPFWKSIYEEKRDKMKNYFSGSGRNAGKSVNLG